MENPEGKSISVIIKLEEFAALNGKLSSIKNEPDLKKFIHNFFSEKYGNGDGKLEIIQKQTKVKLNWTAHVVDSKAEAFHKTALESAKNKHYKEAISSWVKAISINPKDPDYYFNLGIAFFEIKNYKESIENLKRAIAICPIYYRAHLILGTVLLKIRHFEDAEKHLKESVTFNPNHGLAYLNLGAVYSILKRYDDGISMFLKTLDLAPNETRAYFGLGKIYSIKGDILKANQFFKRVIEIDKKSDLANHAKRAIQSSSETNIEKANQDSNLNIDNIYQEGYKAYLVTDYERAIKMYQAYLTQKPDDDFVWFALGEACLRCGLLSKSAESFRKAIKLNPNKALYYKELAIVFYYQQNDSELTDCILKARKFGKSDSMMESLFGYALIQQQNYKEAVAALFSANSKDANNLFCKFYLAIAYMKSGDRNSGINLLQEIRQSHLKSPLLAETERLLSRP